MIEGDLAEILLWERGKSPYFELRALGILPKNTKFPFVEIKGKTQGADDFSLDLF